LEKAISSSLNSLSSRARELKTASSSGRSRFSSWSVSRKMTRRPVDGAVGGRQVEQVLLHNQQRLPTAQHQAFNAQLGLADYQQVIRSIRVANVESHFQQVILDTEEVVVWHSGRISRKSEAAG
jgi:hypothetical protein